MIAASQIGHAEHVCHIKMLFWHLVQRNEKGDRVALDKQSLGSSYNCVYDSLAIS